MIPGRWENGGPATVAYADGLAGRSSWLTS